MSTQATIGSAYKLSTTPGTAVALGVSTLKFSSLILRGYKADGTVNTNNVKYRPVDGEYITIEPGTERVVPIPDGSFLRASQIELDVTTSGDGVQYEYTAAVVYEGP